MNTNSSQQNTVYIVDANFFINFHKWLPRYRFPAFWNELEKALRDGKWILLDVIVNEIRGERELKKWCDKQEKDGYLTSITAVSYTHLTLPTKRIV